VLLATPSDDAYHTQLKNGDSSREATSGGLILIDLTTAMQNLEEQREAT
jgi:hypothetical protein